MCAIVVTYLISAGREEQAAEHFAAMIEPSRAEAGNLRYHAYRSKDEPRKFFLFEEYADEAAFQEHRATPHFEEHIQNGIMTMIEKRSAEAVRPLDQG
jgi:quinol monooxygenase YgiN